MDWLTAYNISFAPAYFGVGEISRFAPIPPTPKPAVAIAVHVVSNYIRLFNRLRIRKKSSLNNWESRLKKIIFSRKSNWVIQQFDDWKSNWILLIDFK